MSFLSSQRSQLLALMLQTRQMLVGSACASKQLRANVHVTHADDKHVDDKKGTKVMHNIFRVGVSFSLCI